MGTGEIIATAITALFCVWYFAGTLLNRRRALQLIQAIREVAETLGQETAIRWYGRSAFAITVAKPHPPLTDVRLLCLLEPRDFPLALAWNRMRGRRDQVVIQASFRQPPRAGADPDPLSLKIPGITEVALRLEPPHLRMLLQVSAGSEAAIAEALRMVRQFSDRNGSLGPHGLIPNSHSLRVTHAKENRGPA